MTLNSDALATKRVIYQQRKPAGEQKWALKRIGNRERKAEDVWGWRGKTGSASLMSEALNPLVTRGLSFFGLNTLIDLFAMYRNFFRRVNPNADLVTFYTQHRYSHLIANHEGFTNSTS
jgi:hypothetical protein